MTSLKACQALLVPEALISRDLGSWACPSGVEVRERDDNSTGWGVTWAGARQFCVAGVSTAGGGSAVTEGFDQFLASSREKEKRSNSCSHPITFSLYTPWPTPLPLDLFCLPSRRKGPDICSSQRTFLQRAQTPSPLILPNLGLNKSKTGATKVTRMKLYHHFFQHTISQGAPLHQLCRAGDVTIYLLSPHPQGQGTQLNVLC